MCSCSLLFSLSLIFTLVAASISHFLIAAIEFSCFSSNEIGLRCFLFLALAISLFPTLIQTLIQTLKWRKGGLDFVVVVFFSLPLSLKVQVAMGFTAETLGVLEMQNLTPAYMKGWTYLRTDDFVTTKISWIHRYNLVSRAFPLKKMGGAGKGPGISWSRAQPKYS